MINTSAEFKEAMKENNTCISKAEILLKDGTKLSIGSNVIQGGIKIDDSVCSTGKFEIGNAISNKLCIYLNNMQDDFSEYDFTDATVTVWIGKMLSKTTEWIKKGVFIAQDPTTTTGIITLECLDYMSKFNNVYDGKLIFPATLQQIIQYCCSRCGVIFSSDGFPNSGYQITKNPFGSSENFTYRVIVQYCAMLAGCFARCNTDGILELKWYDAQAFEAGNYAEVKSFSSLSVSTEDVVITGIRVTASDLENEDKTEKGETYLAGAEGYVLSISGNPLVEYGQAKTVASVLAERIVGMRFRPMTASCLGNPAWEAGDAVLLTDRKGKTYKSFLTNLTYYTGNYESISCDAEPAARHSADHYKEIEQIIANIKRDTRFQLSQYGKYLDQMNGLAINAMGYYETVEIQDDGSRITYMHDKPLMSESMVIYKKSIDGYFWSKDGGKTWTSGIDKNGNAVMNVIAAIGLQAEWIQAGKLQVLDEKGNVIFLVDMDTKQVIISGDSVQIGGKTATGLIDQANTNASEALKKSEEAINAAALARNVTMQLSNDRYSVPVDAAGNYKEFPTDVIVKPMVMYGTKEITEECIFTVTKSENVEGNWDNVGKVYTVTGLTADEGWVDIKATYLKEISVVKRFSVVKLYAGSPGVPGRTYFLEPSTLVLKKGQDNVISPGTVDFKAYYRDGNSASRTAYAGRFKIEETVDGSTWKTIYTSSANESSVKHSTYDYLTDAAGNAIITASGHGIVAAVRDIHMIRCTLYAAGGTTNTLDTQSVTVVKDVKALTQEEVFNILTKNGILQGVYMQNGNLYINGTFMKIGKIVSKNGKVYFDLDNNEIHCDKMISTESYADVKNTVADISRRNIGGANYSYGLQIYNKEFEEGRITISPMRDKEIPEIHTGSIAKKTGLRISSTMGNGMENGSGLGYLDFLDSGMIWIQPPTGNTGLDARIALYPGYYGNVMSGFNSRVEITGYKVVVSATDVEFSNRITVKGSKSRVVETKNYKNRLLYCYETSSPMFGDVGEGKIDDSGICYIYLDDIFTETISTGIEYQVFLQKEGAGDLWVDSKEAAFFIVKGTPGLKFSWEIKAKQRDFEYERLEDIKTTEHDIQNLDYEAIGQELFKEYISEKETTYEGSN